MDFSISGIRVGRIGAAVVLALALLAAGFVPGAEANRSGGVVSPVPAPVTNPNQALKAVVGYARLELGKRVAERRSDNVPRYRNGRGRIAPYSIRDQWCVAFATYAWGRAGFRDYLGTRLRRRSFDSTEVAIQVADLAAWARATRRWSRIARPGYLVVYGTKHIGVVERVDSTGRAVLSIEGNKRDAVRRVRTIDMIKDVTGYISPIPQRLPIDPL